MDSCYGDRAFPCRVPPFGNLRIDGYLRLTAAYRSLLRPSSAPGAKASSLRSSSLDHGLRNFVPKASEVRLRRTSGSWNSSSLQPFLKWSLLSLEKHFTVFNEIDYSRQNLFRCLKIILSEFLGSPLIY